MIVPEFLDCLYAALILAVVGFWFKFFAMIYHDASEG